MENFSKFIKELPSTAKLYENGDACIKREEYVKGKEMFGYYHPTVDGFVLEGRFWRGNAAGKYNHAKMNDENFVPQMEYQAIQKAAKEAKSLEKAKLKAKPKPKAKAKKKAKVKNDKAIRNTADFIKALDNDLKNHPEKFSSELVDNVVKLFK